MRKFIACILAFIAFAPLLASNASGAISRAIPSSKADTERDVSARTDAGRNTVQRTSARSAGENLSQSTVVRAGARVVNTTNSSETPATRTATRTTTTSRAAQNSGAMSARAALDAATNTVGRNSRVTAASLNSNPAVRRAGLSLRPSTAEVGGRAKISGTEIQTGSNLSSELRGVQSRAATAAPTAETISAAKAVLEQTADLNASCQQQYNDCMDQFCAVVDANQKRCSCSANLSRYAKVEEAVKDANNQLNEVAQRIRYVGLSADEIRAILTETEAEEALSGQTDTSETRNMLEEIEKLIQNPTSGSTFSTSGMSSTLDLNLDFSSDSGDMFNLDFLSNDTSTLSNLRGADLYNAAKKRCSTILNQCKDAGATQKQITGNYDLAIDKDCIAYEQGLTKMNETLKTNVRSANNMLQKARLAVLQNKNQYDAKGCIAALETCMTDDMVCGAGYEKCLDPTKIYIDENGEVVLGKDIGDITDFMEKFNNANINESFLQEAYSKTITEAECKKSSDNTTSGDGSCNVKYLLQKIGTGQKVTDGGLCRAVLDKCQNYTYNDGKYVAYNDVVVNYVQRAMVNIKAAQQRIISDYASSCMVDIASCYNQQVTQVNSWSTSASVASIYNVMRGACRNVALTCAYAVFDKDTTHCPTTGNGREDTCITSISQMFYESLLCPENSEFKETECNGNDDGCVNKHCKCIYDYEAYQGACLPKCGTDETRNTYGACVKNPKAVTGTP